MARPAPSPGFGKKNYALPDSFNYTEDNLTLVTGNIVTLDVIANDGNLRRAATPTPYSLDDGYNSAGVKSPIDLLTADPFTQDPATGATTSGWNPTVSGNMVRFYDGKVQLDLSNWLDGKTLQQLTSTNQLADSFTYAIRMSDGTLSWSTVTFNLAGVDDVATFTGTGNKLLTVTPDSSSLSVSDTLEVADLDYGQGQFSSVIGTSQYGNFSWNQPPGSSINWTYTADRTELTFSYSQATFTDSLTATSMDGSIATITLTLSDGALRSNEYAFSADGSDNIIYAGPDSAVVYALGGNDTIYGNNFGQDLNGGAGNDIFYGGTAGDRQYAGDGNDALMGGDGDDYLMGEAGDDDLQGGYGSDLISGGLGTNTLTGGAAADIFFFRHLSTSSTAGAPNNVITDFDATQEMIVLSIASDSAFASLAGATSAMNVFNEYLSYNQDSKILAFTYLGQDGAFDDISFEIAEIFLLEGQTLTGSNLMLSLGGEFDRAFYGTEGGGGR